MRKLVFILGLVLIIFNTKNVYAKQGCCSGHGGVAGCASYGRVICNDGWTGSSCECTPPVVYGCTDSKANNYNSSANKDDGSCTYSVYGCTDSSATNYNSVANASDGSCQYEKEVTEEEVIKFDTQYVNESENKKSQEGKNGTKVNYYKVITDEKGNIISKEKIKEEIVEQPVSEIRIIDDVLKNDNNNEFTQNDDSSINLVIFFYIIFFIVFIILYKKSNKEKTILYNFSKVEKVGRTILYIIYFIFIIPSIIDFIIILRNKKNNNN